MVNGIIELYVKTFSILHFEGFLFVVDCFNLVDDSSLLLKEASEAISFSDSGVFNWFNIRTDS